MTLVVVGSDVWAVDNDSLCGSKEGDDNVEESGSHCRQLGRTGFLAIYDQSLPLIPFFKPQKRILEINLL